jgi:hypothetical protein
MAGSGNIWLLPFESGKNTGIKRRNARPLNYGIVEGSGISVLHF